MRIKAYFLLLALLVGVVLAEFKYSVTASHGGKPVKPSDIVLERVSPGSHQLNRTLSRPKPKPRGGHEKRSNGIMFSSNWCGAIQNSPATNPITTVKGYFQVPTVTQRTGLTSFPQMVAPWVGIDGATYPNAILQSGIACELDSTGVQTNWAWFEWVPDAAYTLSTFPVATGDWIHVTVNTTDERNGNIIITNESQSYELSLVLNNGTPLQRVDADWIVEDPQSNAGSVPFGAFSDTWFEECSAMRADNSVLGINGGIMLYLQNSQNNWCIASEYDNANFVTSSA